MKGIKDEVIAFKTWCDATLERRIAALPVNDTAQQQMKQALEHSLFGSAKRIRAFIIAASCSAFGFTKEQISNLCIAIEYIHCYSLIHDDLPCMDNANERRGKKALHKEFDEATALLTGNSLVTLAIEEILHEDFNVEHYVKSHLLKNLCRAIGYNGMMGGQMMDILLLNSNSANSNQFVHMNKLKTGELFAFCMSTGALLKQNLESIPVLEQIGYDIGYIFQLVDDILDINQDGGTNAERTFVASLGGIEEAKRHLFIIAKQAKLRINKVHNLHSMSLLVDHIIDQL